MSLAKAGYDVYLVAPGESYESGGVKIIGVPQNTGGRLKRMVHGAKAVYKKALEIDADIYQIHDLELLPYALKLKKKGKIVIFDSHENYTLLISTKYYLPGLFRTLVAKLYHLYETRVCKEIDAVIVPCKINNISSFENRAKQVVFIDNTPILDELYVKYTPDYCKRKNSICYVGGLTYERGVSNVVKAAHLANAKLILAGEFSPANYYDEIKALNEYSCVEYRGFVNRENYIEILNECRVGVCTILNTGQYNSADNLATKVYEYMAMGLPAIVSDYSYAEKVNEKYKCFKLVNPDDIEEIANAINYLLDNPEIAEDMGQNGRRAVIEEFNWNLEEKKLLRIYESLAEA